MNDDKDHLTFKILACFLGAAIITALCCFTAVAVVTTVDCVKVITAKWSEKK